MMDSTFSLPKNPSLYTHPNNPYSSSASSAASSSSSSIFSLDGAGSQSSSVSSTSSLHVVFENNSDASSNAHGTSAERTSNDDVYSCMTIKPCPARSETVVAPAEQRTHPRRTGRADSGVQGQSTSATGTCRPPPCLVRQSDRKTHFVDNLVDSATQIVHAIWPLSMVACPGDRGAGRGVLPLRTFIQETLRRSRTSYSTLQVALYYLILIKSHVPKHDFTMEQRNDDPSVRALQCGRRMFLAALILASKYLQDRNYSARAWSKISGLQTQEINLNEMTFLMAVNWRLHISESIFQRWTDVVLKYTPRSHPPSSPGSSPIRADDKQDWSAIISSLTPELDHVDIGIPAPAPRSVERSPVRAVSISPARSEVPPPQEIPNVLEPTPMISRPAQFTLPPLTRLGPLPTPQLTPQSTGFNTPAVGVEPSSRRSSIGSALAQAQNACATRCTLDRWTALPPMDCSKMVSPEGPTSATSNGRRSSLARTCSLASSPESMISDSSSRSSRSSSISSVYSSTCAPFSAQATKLAVQATCRNAKLCSRGTGLSISSKEDRKPLACNENWVDPTWDVSASPESYREGASTGAIPDFSNFCLSTPREMSIPVQSEKQQSNHPSLALLVGDDEDDDATPTARRSRARPASSNHKGRKRGRTNEDGAELQSHVRSLLHAGSQQSTPTPQNHAQAPTVLADPIKASSFLLDGPTKALQSPCRLLPPTQLRMPLQKEMGRKRACCGEEISNSLKAARGPGMWEGVL
ncbi:MAG: hypothetical protein M4579_007116 [Chaenotheca gracillima]|nr:MAG: hypothetical protein M4579_007116 [Chaenotheca gracillima]